MKISKQNTNKYLRLNKWEIEIIKREIEKNFGKCDIYIFGSQTDIKKTGGDVDIYVISSKKIDIKTKLLTKIKLQDYLLKKIDIIISENQNREIEKEAKKGIKIN